MIMMEFSPNDETLYWMAHAVTTALVFLFIYQHIHVQRIRQYLERRNFIDYVNLKEPSKPQKDHETAPYLRSSSNSLMEGQWFIDRHGRRLILRGVNLSGSSKSPFKPFLHSHEGGDGEFFRDLDVSFVGRPFPIEDADKHLSLIRSWGFNVLRLVITWEAIEHFGPGIYDDDYVEFLIAVIRKAAAYDIRVFVDPHQDAWSRQCGGSGAPNWTLRLAGLNSRAFYDCGAAMCHSSWCSANPDRRPQDYPVMIWQTNYYKLACATMFTLFFGGNVFAPRFRVAQSRTDSRMPGDQHFNVQDYLTFHFIQSMSYVAKRINEEGLNCQMDRNGGVLGWDTLNEPDRGWIGCPNLSDSLPWQELRTGATPTPFQSMLAGCGQTEIVDEYDVCWRGPVRLGKVKMNENKAHAWMTRVSPDVLFTEGLQAAQGRKITIDHTSMADEGYQSYNAGSMTDFGCIWAAHNVYDQQAKTLLVPDYFANHPISGETIDAKQFTMQFWMPFVHRFGRALRSIHRPTMLFLGPPVNERPPTLSDRSPKEHPAEFYENLVYTPHWYDGFTLITRRFNPFNIEYLHAKRGIKTIWSALRLGYGHVRAGFQSELALIRQESEQVGDFPTLIGEIGIPFDGLSEWSRRYALDSTLRAIERNHLNATLWNYAVDHDSDLGDFWNGEDLSLVSGSKVRCPDALIRPFPVATSGKPTHFTFDSDSSCFEYAFDSCLYVCALCQDCGAWPKMDPSTTISNDSPFHSTAMTEIFAPSQHFRCWDDVQIAVSNCDNWILDLKNQRLVIYIGNPKAFSQRGGERELNPSCCQACLSPVPKTELVALNRSHLVKMRSTTPKSGLSPDPDRIYSWSITDMERHVFTDPKNIFTWIVSFFSGVLKRLRFRSRPDRALASKIFY
uniref:Glycoside hydrolase family 5 domain-containing protein n=1 Tax=Spongospora subterranea TaxID=70186 RepID=A0A0H5R8H6_9EUKA|eukprot:CRZ10425.1 hypothetical protein [Spongospora subterranea]